MSETKYAIIEIGSKQFMVKEGESIKIFKNVDIKDFSTLLIKDAETLEIGTPAIEKGGVALTYKGDKKVKTDVRRFKGKSRYRVNKSHTDIYSVYTVASIKVGESNTISELTEDQPVIKKEKAVKVSAKTTKANKPEAKKAVVKKTISKKTPTKVKKEVK